MLIVINWYSDKLTGRENAERGANVTMQDVIRELKEQLIYAKELGDEYAVQLEEAITVLKKYEEANTMYEMTLSGLLQAGDSYFARNEADYLVLKIAGATPKAELIINPKENIETKLQYIQKAYSETLTLKNAPHIEITHYNFVTKDELQAYFE